LAGPLLDRNLCCNTTADGSYRENCNRFRNLLLMNLSNITPNLTSHPAFLMHPSFIRRMPGKKTILIVDDDADDIFLLQRAFSKAGINANLQFARDGEEAIRYLQAGDQKHPMPDLLLLDLKMPRIDGFSVLEWVRAQPGLKRLPVAMLTSS